MNKVRAQTLRNRMIGIPDRIAHRAKRLLLHLPRTWPWATDFATTMASNSTTAYTIIVLINQLLFEHNVSGLEEASEKPSWKGPVRDRDTASCPLIGFASESERALYYHADRWAKAECWL